MQNPEIVIIGATIIDVLAYPVNVKVFETDRIRQKIYI